MKAILYILSSIIGLTSCMERPDNSMIGLFKNKSNEQTKISQIKTDSVRNPYIMNYHNGMLVFGDIFQSKFISIFDVIISLQMCHLYHSQMCQVYHS